MTSRIPTDMVADRTSKTKLSDTLGSMQTSINTNTSSLASKANQSDNVPQHNFDVNLASNYLSSSDYLTNGYSTALVSALNAYSPLYLTSNNYNLKTMINLNGVNSFRHLNGVAPTVAQGAGGSPIGASVLIPDNGVTAISYTNTSVGMNGFHIKNIKVANNNYTDVTTKLIDLNYWYTSSFEDCEFRGTINFTETDSAKFINCLFYAGALPGSTITLGKGCRSITFIGCNFEGPLTGNPLNIVIDASYTPSDTLVNGGSNIHFIGCQFENVNITVRNCTDSSIISSKMYKTNVLLERTTANIRIDAATQTGSTIGDFGFNNRINAKGWNAIGTGIEKQGYKPTITYNSDNTVTLSNDLLITQCYAVNTSVTGASLKYNNSGTLLTQSETFNLKKCSSYTSGNESPFTDFQLLSGTNISVVSGTSDPLYIRTVPLKNLIGSTMFTGWSATWNSADNSASCTITTGTAMSLNIKRTTSGAWGVTNSFTFNPSKQYMLLMRYNTTGTKANFQAGNMLRTQDVSYQYQLPTGDYLAQSYVSGTYENKIYIGGFSSTTNDVVTIQWVALVELN